MMVAFAAAFGSAHCIEAGLAQRMRETLPDSRPKAWFWWQEFRDIKMFVLHQAPIFSLFRDIISGDEWCKTKGETSGGVFHFETAHQGGVKASEDTDVSSRSLIKPLARALKGLSSSQK